jgi:hypothetical protein
MNNVLYFKKLLDFHKSDNGTKMTIIEKLKNDMDTYIATPWEGNNPLNNNTYIEKIKEEKGDIDINTLSCTNLKNKKLCESHGGDLFQHSQWSALQIDDWFKNKNEITEGVDYNTAIVSAFFHDIGKGGDCIHDMYSSDKYGKKGDSFHPNYSGKMILGKIKYIIDCKTKESISIKDLISNLYPSININEVALAAFMHWEFGKLNIGNADILNERIDVYIQTFKKYCEECNLKPSLKLLKLCIIVSCADISAGTNERIKNEPYVSKRKYVSSDPWSAYGMDKKYLIYRKDVLNQFNKSNSFGFRKIKKNNTIIKKYYNDLKLLKTF